MITLENFSAISGDWTSAWISTGTTTASEPSPYTKVPLSVGLYLEICPLTFFIMCAIANRTSTRPPALLIADIASLFNASINPGTQWITNSVIKEPSLKGRTFIVVFSKEPDSFATSFISPSNWLRNLERSLASRPSSGSTSTKRYTSV